MLTEQDGGVGTFSQFEFTHELAVVSLLHLGEIVADDKKQRQACCSIFQSFNLLQVLQALRW
jgi:hypothetical protein